MEVNDSLLNLDGHEEQAPGSPPEGDEGQGGEGGESSPKDSKVNEKIASLEETNKQLQEQMRQMAERSKPFEEFYNRIMANNDDEKKKREIQETLKEYEEDPIGVTAKLIDKKLIPLEEAFMQNVSIATTKEAMAAIDKKHNVDWGKYGKAIAAKLATMKEESKKKDPQGTLLDACKLVGAVNDKKEENELPVVEETIRSGGRPAPQKHADKVNERMNKVGNKKKENVFGI